MKFIYEIWGRPKNEKIDRFMSKLNKTYKEISGDHHNLTLGAKLGEMTIKAEAELSEEDMSKILAKAKEVFEEYFSDVSIKKI